MKTTAKTITAALRAAIDDLAGADDMAQDAIRAIATALEDRAELTRTAEPYASRSIDDMLRAASRVRDLIDLMNEADDLAQAEQEA